MYASRWAQGWLSAGLLWFLLAIAFAPASKIYQQGLVVLVWLPSLMLAWSARVRLGEFWRGQRGLCLALLLLFGWAALSLFWTQAEDPSREFKRILYIAVFLLLFPILAAGQPERVIRLMQWGGVGLGVAALVSMVKFFGISGNAWSARLEGIGGISHPILGAYVVGVAAVWMWFWPPRNRWLIVVWLLALASAGAFVMLSQSRSALLALFFTIVCSPIWCRDRRSCFFAGGAVLVAVIGFWLFEPYVLSRGSSFRPEIFAASLKMIMLHPFTGLGLGSDYKVAASGLLFGHSHNLFTHTAIELGIPGLLLWTGVWFAILREAWKARNTTFGRGLVGVWLFSTLAMQFDAASLTGSPRAEWFISWLPIGLASVLVWVKVRGMGCDKIPSLSNQ